MSIEGQTQVAQRAVFSWHRFDNLLVEVAAGFFTIQRQPVANLDAFARARHQVALFVIYPGVQDAAVMGQLRQQLINALLVRCFAAHQRHEIQYHLLRQRAGQLFQLRIALFLTVLTDPRSALHQRDE